MRSKSAELKTKICDTVNDWKRNVGRTPSLKELGDELGVNKSTIYRYLVEMNEDGLLEYDGSSIDTKELNRRTMNTARAAIVGSIPCGEAQPEEEYVEEYAFYCYLEENRKRLIKNHSHRLFLNMIAMDIIGMGIMRLAETDKVNIIVIIM